MTGPRGKIFDVEAARAISRSARRTETPGGMHASGGSIAVASGERGRDPLPRSTVAIEVEITAIQTDHLECKRVNPSTGAAIGETFTVAKPYQLRRTPFDLASVTFPDVTVSYTYTNSQERTAGDGTATETQRVTPNYYVGDRLVALRMATGLTVSDIPVRWVDLNLAARAWAEVPDDEGGG